MRRVVYLLILALTISSCSIFRCGMDEFCPRTDIMYGGKLSLDRNITMIFEEDLKQCRVSIARAYPFLGMSLVKYQLNTYKEKGRTYFSLYREDPSDITYEGQLVNRNKIILNFKDTDGNYVVVTLKPRSN